MRRRTILLAAPALITRPALARLPAGGVVYYHGPGDISPSTWFAGLRGYSALTANLKKAVNVRRSSDNATTDIGLINGTLDQASAATFAGSDVVGTGSISGYTLTFVGGAIGDAVYGGRLGTVITGGASPTWTVDCPGHISQTVASTTITIRKGLYITALYDQLGSGNDAVQATTALQPQLFLYGQKNSTLPYMSGNIAGSASGSGGGKYGTQYLKTISAINLGTVYSLSVYVQPIPIGASTMIMASTPVSNTLALYQHANGPNGSNIINLANGGVGEPSSVLPNSSTTWRTMQMIVNGAGSLQYISGAVTATAVMDAVVCNSEIGIMANAYLNDTDPNDTKPFVGNATEFDMAASTAFTPTQYAARAADQVSYWQ